MAANLQHLRAFHAIAIEGGVSRAARRLNVSQPTLSQQLKALEARHGVRLFDGRSTPLELTSAGRELLLLTQRLFTTADEVDELLRASASISGGEFRLGSDTPLYAARVADLFRRRHPNGAARVRMGNAGDVMRWLAEAQVDAALATDPPVDPAFVYQPLAEDRLLLAVWRGHPLAGDTLVPFAALRTEVLLQREATSGTRALVQRALDEADVAPRAVLELGGREVIREAIALGLGVSLFLSSECPPDLRLTYVSLDFAGRDYRSRTVLLVQAHRRRSELMRAVQAVVALLHGSVVHDVQTAKPLLPESPNDTQIS